MTQGNLRPEFFSRRPFYPGNMKVPCSTLRQKLLVRQGGGPRSPHYAQHTRPRLLLRKEAAPAQKDLRSGLMPQPGAQWGWSATVGLGEEERGRAGGWRGQTRPRSWLQRVIILPKSPWPSIFLTGQSWCHSQACLAPDWWSASTAAWR